MLVYVKIKQKIINFQNNYYQLKRQRIYMLKPFKTELNKSKQVKLNLGN